jgi:hypothetical protein
MNQRPILAWRKARRSIAMGECVEAASASGRIFVRDSKNPRGLVIGYDAETWILFTKAIRCGRFGAAAA